MRITSPADERTGAAAPTFAITRDPRGRDQSLVGCQPQIVVRPKVDQLLAIQRDARRLRTMAHGKSSPQTRTLQFIERAINPTQWITKSHCQISSPCLLVFRVCLSPPMV